MGQRKLLRLSALVLVAAVVAACNGMTTSAGVHVVADADDHGNRRGRARRQPHLVDRQRCGGHRRRRDVVGRGAAGRGRRLHIGRRQALRPRRRDPRTQSCTATAPPQRSCRPPQARRRRRPAHQRPGLRQDRPGGRTTATIDTDRPAGTVFLDECITQIIVTLHARASTSAPPTIADFGVALDSNQDNVNAVVTLTDLHVPVDVDARVLGIPTSCDLVIDADSVTIDGNYALQPSPTDPTSSTSTSSAPRRWSRWATSTTTSSGASAHPRDRADRRPVPARRADADAGLTWLLGDADGPAPSTRRLPTPSSRPWRRSTSPVTSAPPSGCGSTRTSRPPTRTRTASTCTPPPRSRRARRRPEAPT